MIGHQDHLSGVVLAVLPSSDLLKGLRTIMDLPAVSEECQLVGHRRCRRHCSPQSHLQPPCLQSQKAAISQTLPFQRLINRHPGLEYHIHQRPRHHHLLCRYQQMQSQRQLRSISTLCLLRGASSLRVEVFIIYHLLHGVNNCERQRSSVAITRVDGAGQQLVAVELLARGFLGLL
jgi:hypothetical protein